MIKIANITKLITSITIIILTMTAELSASQVYLRFSEADYNQSEQELYVDIEVAVEETDYVILAGQNYRFFYNSEVLELDAESITSHLSTDHYSPVSVDSHTSGIDADRVNQLPFDSDLGFVNLSIDLHNLEDGGKKMTSDDGWVKIMRLKFDVKREGQGYDIVWGRDGVSDLYATAFVEMGEWIGNGLIDRVSISSFGDLSSQDRIDESPLLVDVKVGPNPTADYIHITLDQELQEDVNIILRDMTGKIVQSKVIAKGSIESTVDLSNLISASYMCSVIDAHQQQVHNSILIVSK